MFIAHRWNWPWRWKKADDLLAELLDAVVEAGAQPRDTASEDVLSALRRAR